MTSETIMLYMLSTTALIQTGCLVWVSVKIAKLRRRAYVDQAIVEHSRKILESHRGLERKLQAQANINDALQQEKLNWRTMYRESAVTSGAAQDMMMRQIQELSFRLRKHDIPHEIDPVLQQVAEQFHSEHVKNYYEPRRSHNGRGDDSSGGGE